MAFKYYFQLPSYYILVMRSFVTLEGIALEADGEEFNMYAACAPYALRKLARPTTDEGRAFRRDLLSRAGVSALWKARRGGARLRRRRVSGAL